MHAYNTVLLTNYIRQVYKRQNNIINVLRHYKFYSVSIMQIVNSNKINNDDKFTILQLICWLCNCAAFQVLAYTLTKHSYIILYK